MSTRVIRRSCSHDNTGSFFKLIDSFACEIGTLKKEMGRKTETAGADQTADTEMGLSEDVGSLFLQASPCSGRGPGLAGVRDSGYESLHRRLAILDRLMHTHAVWLQLGLSHQDAIRILQDQPAGSFVVRKSSSLQRKVLSVRMDKDSTAPVTDFPVKESQYTFSLEGSDLRFADLFRLVAFCCISRDVLPFTLKLPEAVASARTFADLEEVAKLGAGFWDVQSSSRKKGSVWLLRTAAPDRPPPPAQRPASSPAVLLYPQLRTRTPSELECSQSNGALCFINPLFIKIHQSEAAPDTPETATPSRRKESDRTEDHRSDRSEENQTAKTDLQSFGRNSCCDAGTRSSQTSGAGESESRSPPPRPPRPRFVAQCSSPPGRRRTMPEKVAWINPPTEKETKKSSRPLSHGASFGTNISSSPPERIGISSPISIPRPEASSYRALALGHSALEDQTIRTAIRRAKLARYVRAINQGSCSPSDPSQKTVSTLAEVGTGEEALEGCSGGGQRLSDMSFSTDSSDSLDSSQCSAFFNPPLHDPSPPTEADFNNQLPLSRPLSHLRFSGTDVDDDDEDDDDEEEPDVSLESDQEQDQDVTMVPPGHRVKRKSSASAMVIQKALRGNLRKMSGVFNSLLTPEKRAVRKVRELSRDKSSYFGSLVQDYLSYMGEGAGTQAWQGYASGLELLQTVRQFITQMKIYLRQTSEMEPPIESLIPEDQIDRVLEKALLKSILKPLRPVVSAALHEFQVRSGALQELKENLALAKARHPQEMGVANALPPDSVAIEKIKNKVQTMCKLYNPEKKVVVLLRVCKLIYTIMEENSGRFYGADDFLPMLTYVLAQCDMPQLDNEILYMMELLDPSLLHGEGGYYLTSAYGAMSLIKNFQEDQAARVLSSETRNTLHQWHRRRTTQRSAPAPSIDDFQNYLRVALQELNSGCTAKTIPVRPHATVEDVCQLCAVKFKVSDPENYGLFLQVEGSSQQLAPDTHPQKIKAELHSRSQAAPFHFVFRRVAKSNALSTAHPNLNHTTTPSDPAGDHGPVCPLPQPHVGSDLSQLNSNSVSV